MSKIISKSFCRSTSDRYIAGVCGGLAEYFEVDSTLVRLLSIASIISGGVGLLIYLVMWIIIPTSSSESSKPEKTKVVQDKQVRSQKSLWGLMLIGLGIVLLLENFGIGRYLMLQKTWPAIFIVLGLVVLSR